jgi:uncharacterized protein YjdB
MATPFMHVDLSQTSRDFQAIALEPGLPLLDRANSCYHTLRKWLGPLVAEPERHGDRIAFYVRDEAGGRLDSVLCVQASESDLSGELAKDFKDLKRRVDEAKPQTTQEQLIHRALVEQLRALLDDTQSNDRRCYLFKYKDRNQKYHLIWCVGYRRRDNQPLAAVVCTNANCSHLFMRRSENQGKCPVCKSEGGKALPPPTPERKGLLKKVLGGLAIFAVGLAIGLWLMNRKGAAPDAESLTIDPPNWSGPVGGQVTFAIKRGKQDVTASATGSVADPRVLKWDRNEHIATAVSPGQTEVTFTVDRLTVTSKISVNPRSLPNKLRLDPEQVELIRGGTTQVKVVGEFDGGSTVDLTRDAEWVPAPNAKFTVQQGWIEGNEEGEDTLQVRYRAESDGKPIEVTGKVVVRSPKLTALKLKLDPTPPTATIPARLTAVVIDDKGKEHDVNGARALVLSATPSIQLSADGRFLTATAQGDFKVTATYEGFTDVLEGTAGPGPGEPAKGNYPTELELKIGEVARLDLPESAQLKSADPKVVSVQAEALKGEAEGSTEVQVLGESPATIKITVKSATWKSIVIEPATVRVRIDEVQPLRVFGVMDGGQRAELSSDLVRWVNLPRPEFVAFDQSTLKIKGIKSTGDRGEPLAAHVGSLEATAEVVVSDAPFKLFLYPDGPLQVPVGQKRKLRIEARYGRSLPAAVDPSRVTWLGLPEAGLRIVNGEIHALDMNAQAKLKAVYQGTESNSLEVMAVTAVTAKLQIAAEPDQLAIGEAGQLRVTATSDSGDVSLSTDGFRFESADPVIVEVDEMTGAFRAVNLGTVTLNVKHPSIEAPTQCSVTVIEKPKVPKVERVQFLVVPPGFRGHPDRPSLLKSLSTPLKPVSLPIRGEFSDWQIIAVDDQGVPTDVTSNASVEVDGDATNPPAILDRGRIVGMAAGEVTLRAIYQGVPTNEGLVVRVVESLEPDEIQLQPVSIRLKVGESTTLRVLGVKDGLSIGSLDHRADLTWKSSSPETLDANDGDILAKRVGTATVTVTLGKLTSKPATVQVVDDPDWGTPVAGKLVVEPSPLSIRVGQTAWIGRDIRVRRGETDFSNQCQVTLNSDRYCRLDEESRSLQGMAPGRTRITFTQGDQSASIDLDVMATRPPDAKSRVVIEPSRQQLSIAETLPITVYVVAPDGTRTAVTAALQSSNSKIASINDSMLLGVAEGDITLEARVPGVDKPGLAQFTVKKSEISRLVFRPSVLELSVGESASIGIRATTDDGMKSLGDDPNLQLSLAPPKSGDPVVELNAADRTIVGLAPGEATLNAKWDGKVEAQLTVRVRADEIQELVLQPKQLTVVDGDEVEFQVFTRRGGRLQPFRSMDGLDLQVTNSVIADLVDGEFRVRGLKAGQTQITAKLGSLRAVAALTVTPRTTPPPPPAREVSLRIIPGVLRLDQNSSGADIRVVRVMADGTEDREDVAHLVTFQIKNPEIISIERTSSGPFVKPTKAGETEVEATLGSLRSRTPLLVEVTATETEELKFVAYPSELNIEVGESARIDRAEVAPKSGGRGTSIPFNVRSRTSKLLEIRSDGTVVGLSDGTAVVTIVPRSTDKKYAGLSASTVVRVSRREKRSEGKDSTKSDGSSKPGASQLTLIGPSETTEGAEIDFRVEIVSSDRGTDVTNRAKLVIAAENEELAEIRPGGRLKAKRTGRLSVHARLDGMTSLPHDLVIQPRAADFESLDLEIARHNISIGESRNYQLWGKPRGGGSRQDLTSRLTTSDSDPSRPRLNLKAVGGGELPVNGDEPGTLNGLRAGRFAVQVTMGRLASRSLELEVVASDNKPVRMRVEPEAIEILVGQPTQSLRVQVTSIEDRAFRTLATGLAEITAADPKLLKTSAPGQFTAIKTGKTSIQVKFQGLEQTIPVVINGDPFARIDLGENPIFTANSVTVDLTVTGSAVEGDLEYRAVLPDSLDGGGEWTAAERSGDLLKAKIRSPKIPLIRGSNEFNITLEARNRKDGSIVRTPFPFKVTTGRQKPPESR